MKTFVALISVALLASPALAQPMGGVTAGSGTGLPTDNNDVPESTGAGDERTADSERRICRRIETATGSRMNYRRVCRTAEQWRNAQRGS